MVRVDVGCYLEDKAGELGFVGRDRAFLCHRGTRIRGDAHETVEQFLHAKVIQSRSEENRSHLGIKITLHAELRINAIHQFKIFAELGSIPLSHLFIKFLAVDVDGDLLGHFLFVGCEEVEVLLIDIIDSLELCPLIDGP